MEVLRSLALTGGDWVIYLLLGCSVVAVAVIIERYVVLSREAEGLAALRQKAAGVFSHKDWSAIAKEISQTPGLVSSVLSAGVSQAAAGPAAAEDCVAAALADGRAAAEQRLLILGTLGNNAPFIGLFGTVLGVIKAFHDLAQSSSEGPEMVMQGLSQALIATAVGLFVAIPCVIAYNYFQKQVKDLMTGAESMSRRLLARLKSGPHSPHKEP